MDEKTVLNEEETAEKAEFSDRYESAKCACRGTLERLKSSLKAANGNPFIRATSPVRYEILRNPNDEEPLDTFEIRKVHGCSLRTLAIAATILTTAEILAIRAKIKKAKEKK